jgi:serine protease Do
VTPALHPTAQLRVILTFHDGSRHRAELIGTDPRTNLALVRSSAALPHYLEPYAEKIEARQSVELVGHSMVEPISEAGFVTQVRMSVRLLDIYGVHPEETIPLGCVFVVAAPTSPCNPGTACLDTQGRLVGVVLGCAPAQVMAQAKGEPAARLERSFVVPSRRILKITQALREHKQVVRADFGFSLASVSDALRAQLPDLPACAATVHQLSVKGPAAQGGLRNNDILLAVNGRAPEDVHLLRELLTECDPQKSAKLTVLRAGKKLELSVEPASVR